MLELIDLSKRFGDVQALDRLTLCARPGRVHGFVGRNGAGKTTTMRIAVGLMAADSGDVRWNGEPVTADSRRDFGYMPEERGLYPKMTASSQVAYFGRLSGLQPADATAAAARVLADLGLADRAGEPVERLSLGNQQRVQLAVALVASPGVLILDEPFSGLDPVGVDALAAVLRQQVDRGAAVVFSSHQLDLVERLCDEVTIVEAGRVAAAGTIAALRTGRGPQRLRVALDGGWMAWADALPGVRRVPSPRGEVLLDLEGGTDSDAVLDAARAAGRLVRFEHVTPSLAELFREVVPR